jgi:nicotinate-nucleotide pyrophosphorylase
VQHFSCIATLTPRYVEGAASTGLVGRNTRKTIPGLRALAKYAVRTGGGTTTNGARRRDPGEGQLTAVTWRGAVYVSSRVPREASRGITLGELPAVAATGVRYIAIGALPRSAPAAT